MNEFVKVAEYRNGTDHANRISNVDFHACHKTELPYWLERAKRVLSLIEGQSCKRAKMEDIESRERAITSLKNRILAVENK